MFKLPSVSFKGILLALFVNWWWGFWKRSKEEIIPLYQEDVTPPAFDENGRALTEDEVSLLSEAGISQEGINSLAPDDYMINTEAGLFHESWKHQRLWLSDAGEKKVNVIKLVKILTGLGLREAKAFVDAAGNITSFMGPFKESVEDVVDAFNVECGAQVCLCEIDWDDGEMQVNGVSEFVQMLYDHDCDEYKNKNDTTTWVLNEHLEGSHLFAPPYASEEENILFWMPLSDELEASREEDNSSVEEPEAINFGHEDTELIPGVEY